MGTFCGDFRRGNFMNGDFLWEYICGKKGSF
jgi:hypothetical protein